MSIVPADSRPSPSVFAVLCGAMLASSAVLPSDAAVFAPRLVSPHTADAYSMQTFARHKVWKDLDGDAKAWAIFSYLSDRETGLFPLGDGAWEGKDNTYEFALVRDPVKLINVYGYAYCDVLGPVMAGMWEDMELGRARTVNIPGWGHVVAEVFYDDRWHYLDLDVRAAFRRENGSLASLEEARNDASLWDRPNDPRFFPLDDLQKVQPAYQKSELEHRYGVHTGGHTMDFVLRQGETFVRWWKPQQGRWNHLAVHHENEALRDIINREPGGPKSKHPSFTTHTHGNGRFVYQPHLTADSTDFEDGVYDAENVQAGADGLTLAMAGEGHAIFEVRAPYVIVPLVGKLETTDDDAEASIVELDAEGTSIEFSGDNGATWEPLTVKTWPARIDLTTRVAGTYGYLLKLVLKGKPGEAVVRSLRMTTWVQLAPASLPGLRQGINRLELRTGDHYGLDSRVVEVRTNSADVTEFSKYLLLPPADYDPKSRTSRLKGPFVIRVSPPPGARIAWFSAGGSFQTHQQQAARKTANRMEYAVDRPADFVALYEADIPADQSHWHYNAQREVRLDRPAETVYLRYTGDPAVNNVRVYAHCVDERARPASPLRIRHVWMEEGEERSSSRVLDGPQPYQIEVTGQPENVSVELAVPSRLRASIAPKPQTDH